MVLVEDHANFRRSLRLLLDHEQDMQVIAEASDLETAMRQVASKPPYVLVLNLPMPNGSSVETIQTLRAQAPNTEIVVITMHDSQKFADQAIKPERSGSCSRTQPTPNSPKPCAAPRTDSST